MGKTLKRDHYDKVIFSSKILRAFVHPLRLKMLELISTNQSIYVKDIHSRLGLEQSLVSQHLRLLRQANLVIGNREGKYIYYSVNELVVGNLLDAIRSFVAKADLSKIEVDEEDDYL
jgi:DNA-binding transcriptional ArsR family regulator